MHTYIHNYIQLIYICIQYNVYIFVYMYTCIARSNIYTSALFKLLANYKQIVSFRFSYSTSYLRALPLRRLPAMRHHCITQWTEVIDSMREGSQSNKFLLARAHANRCVPVSVYEICCIIVTNMLFYFTLY
jgi:hypothetical protein